SIRKRDRPQLLATLDKIMAYKENQTSENLIINDINHEPVDSQQYYMERYGLEPPTALIIDKDYFKKAFGYSAFIFLIMFILFYIIVSFFTLTFAKVRIDWMGVYQLRQKLEQQEGFTYYFYQIKYFLDALLFHASYLIAPFGLLFLLIRYLIRKMNK